MLAANTFAKSLNEFETLDCLISYLDTKNLLDESFPRTKILEPCNYEDIVKPIIETVNSGIETFKRSNFKSDPECTLKNLKGKGFEDQLLVKKAYITATHMSDEEKKEKLVKVEEKIEEILFTAIISCDKVRLFLSKFSSEDEGGNVNKNELYCIRKFAIDNNINDITVYNHQLNTTGVDLALAEFCPIIIGCFNCLTSKLQ